jgi:hypothetical protein
MYDLTECPLCNKQYIRETTITEYNVNGKYYYDVKDGNWCLPKDMCNQILQQINHVLKDGMSLKELCMRLMELFDLTKKTACNYTNWLINTVPVYLPDRKHIRLIKT